MILYPIGCSYVYILRFHLSTLPQVCFCPSLTPLRFLRTLGRGANNIAVIVATDPTHAVIAEARAHTRYGTGSVVAVGYPRSPHIAVIPTPAGSHICSSGSCGGKALAHVFAATAMHKTVTARTNTPYTPQEQIKNLPLRILHNLLLKQFVIRPKTNLQQNQLFSLY